MSISVVKQETNDLEACFIFNTLSKRCKSMTSYFSESGTMNIVVGRNFNGHIMNLHWLDYAKAECETQRMIDNDCIKVN